MLWLKPSLHSVNHKQYFFHFSSGNSYSVKSVSSLDTEHRSLRAKFIMHKKDERLIKQQQSAAQCVTLKIQTQNHSNGI